MLVIIEVRSEGSFEMVSIQNHEMVQALSSNRANEPLCVSVLPGACWCRQYLLNAQGLQPLANGGAINAIAVTNQIFRRISLGTSFNDLLCNPFCRGMVCHVEVQY